jgi:ribosomal protein S18 acetylase RimI-like enzyme
MNLTIRDAKLDDSEDGEALVEIIDSYARGAGGQRAPLSEHARSQLAKGLLELRSATALLALADGRAIGAAVCLWGFSTFAGRASVNICDFAVLPEFQRKGVGSRLLLEVERRAKERGCCKITLEVHDSNRDAKRLYERMGFGPWQSPTLFVTKPL